MDLDDALLRRLPKRVYCAPLDEKGRFEFIRKVINQVDNCLTDDEIKTIAKKTTGYSNSDLQELCKEAAFEPVRELSSEQILKLDKFRDINIKDLNKALGKIRGTLSNKVVKEIENWNNQFGGGS
jgi:SpoVK/Ycf46/Vps4 family AAA+-type ATPase